MQAASTDGSGHNTGPPLLRDMWAFAGVSIVVMIMRILAKIRIRKLGWDDILMTFALCLSLVGSAIITVAVQHGYGRSVGMVSDVSTVIMYDYLGQTFGICGGVMGRIAFIVLINGLLAARKQWRAILWALMAAQIIINVLFILIIFLQCPGHASAIWSDSDSSENCWDLRVQTYYGYFEGSFNSATDLYLAAFSTYVFWHLNLKVQVKIGLIVLLGLGLFAMVASIVKTIQIHVLASASSDPTMATVNLERWLYIETYLVIISTSIPCIRPLFRPFNRSREYSYGTRSNNMYYNNNTHELNSPYAENSASSFRTRTRMSALSGRTGGSGSGAKVISKRQSDFEEIGSEDETASGSNSGGRNPENEAETPQPTSSTNDFKRRKPYISRMALSWDQIPLSWHQILGILLIIGTLYLRSRSEDSTLMPTGKAIEVDNDVVFKALTSSGPVIVDFYATWCGPCKAIAPKIAQWSEEHTNVRFLKVDVDKMRQIAQENGITAMPTFIVFKDGKSVQTIRGANVPELQKAIESLAA